MTGALHLIPVPIDEEADDIRAQGCLAPEALETLYTLNTFLVETPKTARRWLKLLGHPQPIATLTLQTIPESDAELKALLEPLKGGASIGVLSDAGCPGVADPGARPARLAHQCGYTVIPHVGPSSILLALMGSGLDGQRFTFHGYLPIDDKIRLDTLVAMEKESKKHRSTQLFIETPYRNDALFAALVAGLKPTTWLTVAVHVMGLDASIKTLQVKDWQRQNHPPLPKRPTLFGFLAD